MGNSRDATITVGAHNALDSTAYDFQCDGTADEVQINAAIAALPASESGRPGGGRVQLSDGVFTIAAFIDITPRRVTLAGCGTDATTIVAGANIALGGIHATSNNPTVYLRDFRYDGVKATYGSGSHGISLNYCPTATLENININDCVGSGVYANNSEGAVNGVRLRNVISTSNDGSGFFLSAVGVQMDGCYSLTNAVHGIYTDQGESIIRHCNADQDGDRGIYLNVANRTSVIGCVVSDAKGDSSGMSIELRDSAQCMIIGNRILNGGDTQANVAAIYVLGNGNTIVGNVIEDTKSEVTIRAGIWIDSASANNVISNNTIKMTAGRGLNESSTANSNIFSNNNIIDASDGSLFVGALTRVQDNLGHVASGDVISITKVIDHAALTDNGDATARIDFAQTIPAGSIIKSVKCDFIQAFNSDDTSTLTMMIGIPTDLDDFSKTSTPGINAFNHTTDVFWGESACQDPVVVAAVIPRVTFTEDDDGTDIINSTNAAGQVTITISYMKA